MHLGWWNDNEPFDNLERGGRKFTEEMVEWAEIKEGQKFINIDCGFGYPEMMLAEKRLRANRQGY